MSIFRDPNDLAPTPSRRRFLRQAGIAAAAIGLAPALGGEAAARAAAPIAPLPPPNGGKPITLTMWNPWPAPSPQVTSYTAWIDGYQKAYPNVTIKLYSFPFVTHWTKLIAAMQTGQGPDIDPMTVGYYSAFWDAGWLVPFPETLFPHAQMRKEYQLFDQALAPDGNLYIMLQDYSVPILLYNKQVWREGGLSEKDLPTTWDDCLRLARHLTIRKNGTVQRYGFNVGADWLWFIEDLYYQLGGYIYSADLRQVIYNNDKMIQAIQTHQDMVSKYGVGSFTGAEATLLGQGKNAMMRAWAWMVGLAQQANPHVEIGAAPLPTYTGKPKPYGTGVLAPDLAVLSSASPERREAAFHFLHWIFMTGNRVKNAIDFANIDGGVTPYLPAQSYQTGLVIPAIKARGGDAVYTQDLSNDVQDPLSRAIQQIELTHMSPKAALDQAVQTANHKISGRKLIVHERDQIL